MSSPTPATGRTPSALDALANDYVDRLAAKDPFLATQLGIAGHDGEVTDHSPAAVAERDDLARELLAAIAEVPDADEVDTVTRAALQERLGLELEAAPTRLGIAAVNNLASVLQSRDVLDLMPTDTAEDWQVLAERMDGFPRSLSTWAESLREAAASGVLSSRRQLVLGAEQARGYAEDGGFFDTFAGEAVGDDAQRRQVRHAADAARAAYRELAGVLDELAPQAPEADAVGRDVYRLASRTYLGTEVDLEETYAWGIEELRAIIAEQEQVATRLNERYGTGGGSSVAAAKEALNADPARLLHGTDALQAWMQDLSDTAVRDLAGTHFDIPEPLHRLECRIARTGSGGIYYTGPSEDLTRPGRMWWDVPEGTEEFRTWEQTTTVYHEGVPGHHLQVGVQTMQTKALNRWRAMLCWVSGHGEGWALYAERLMEQLGYLEDDGDRMGMLDAQRFRAGRVVLDIGLHLGLPMPTGLPGADGGAWDEGTAWEFMTANWGMEEAERRFELNRYLGWPGQAPSYKVGQRTWEQIRDRVTAADSSPQAVRDFHRRALELGSLPLSVLEGAL
ncbi:DUF885 domain-containing protein [Brachybacterium aquaticum]|uniref:Uncharacterized protein (DUF885 family) n=1 Tax=Brachybacterium aquaticum TaxID=1432564 RepID=A0A841AC74_9MICO|nr:DUF885 domain-containing protein [Brachybacterium aquaticum]MBB5830892.1 uncharacterized protein (DUF885 family) [Brachybacterium aquaticum]